MEKPIISAAFGLAAAAALATSAQADSQWEGLYAGIHSGYLWGEPTVGDGVTIASDDFDGFAGGVGGGYNHVFDQVLVGMEADVALSGADGTATSTTVGEGVNADLDWLSTVRGRLGFVHDDLLFFATGGLAMGGLGAEVFGSGPGYDLDETAFGYTIGGGIEWAVADRMTVKAEYLYVDLANEDLDVAVNGFDNVGLETSLVRLGVNWRF